MQRIPVLMAAASIAAGTLTGAQPAHAAQDPIQNDKAMIKPAPALSDSMIIYRGQLAWRGEVIDGAVDLMFRFFTEEVGEDEIGSPVVAEGWEVTNGRVAVAFELDDPHYLEHGAWMEITVDGVTLSPRQFVAAPGFSLITQGVDRLDARDAVKVNELGVLDADDHHTAPQHTLDPVSRLRFRATTDQHLAHAGRADRPAPGGGFFRTITPPDGGISYDRFYDDEDDADDYGVHGLRNNHNDGWLLRGDDIVWTRNFVGINVGNPTARLDVKGASRFRGNVMMNKRLTVEGDLITPGLRVIDNAESPNFIGGFEGNEVGAGVVGATIGGGGIGGSINNVLASYGTIGGGSNNTASGLFATVPGGRSNTASGSFSTVGGGEQNTASGYSSTVGGGEFNIASGIRASVGGGLGNTASGLFATVPGGISNTAAGVYSFAAGRRAKANHEGAFVWGDSTSADITSSANDQFTARTVGGARFFTNTALTAGVTLAAGGSSWAPVSDRNMKENFQPVNPVEVLQHVISMPISTWNYKSQDASIRHMGPMAQDFTSAFGLGEDELRINTINADGVALAAIQGVYQLVQEKDAEIESLRESHQQEMTSLRADNSELRSRLNYLEAMMMRAGLLD